MAKGKTPERPGLTITEDKRHGFLWHKRTVVALHQDATVVVESSWSHVTRIARRSLFAFQVVEGDALPKIKLRVRRGANKAAGKFLHLPKSI